MASNEKDLTPTDEMLSSEKKAKFIQARVPMGGPGRFADPLEILPHSTHAFGLQPSLFPIREDWSHYGVTRDEMKVDTPDPQPFEMFVGGNTTMNSRRRAARVKPIGGKAEFGACSWSSIYDSLRYLLLTLENDEWAADDGIQAFLQVLTVGVESRAIATDYAIAITSSETIKNPEHTVDGSNGLLPVGAMRVKEWTWELGSHGQDYGSMREAWGGYRFVIGSIHYPNPPHWMGYVFDRRQGQLIVLDTLVKGRAERVRHAGLVWREVLAKMGLHYDFDLFGLPYTDQPNAFCCGYLMVYCMALLIRGFVGVTCGSLNALDNNARPKIDSDSRKPAAPFDPLFRDWCGAGPPSPERKWQQVEAILAGVLLDVLGCAHPEVMGENGKVTPKALQRIAYRWAPAVQPTWTLKKADLYGPMGGYLVCQPTEDWPERGRFDDHRAIKIPEGSRGVFSSKRPPFQVIPPEGRPDVRRLAHTVLPRDTRSVFESRGYAFQDMGQWVRTDTPGVLLKPLRAPPRQEPQPAAESAPVPVPSPVPVPRSRSETPAPPQGDSSRGGSPMSVVRSPPEPPARGTRSSTPRRPLSPRGGMSPLVVTTGLSAPGSPMAVDSPRQETSMIKQAISRAMSVAATDRSLSPEDRALPPSRSSGRYLPRPHSPAAEPSRRPTPEPASIDQMVPEATTSVPPDRVRPKKIADKPEIVGGIEVAMTRASTAAAWTEYMRRYARGNSGIGHGGAIMTIFAKDQLPFPGGYRPTTTAVKDGFVTHRPQGLMSLNAWGDIEQALIEAAAPKPTGLSRAERYKAREEARLKEKREGKAKGKGKGKDKDEK